MPDQTPEEVVAGADLSHFSPEVQARVAELSEQIAEVATDYVYPAGQPSQLAFCEVHPNVVVVSASGDAKPCVECPDPAWDGVVQRNSIAFRISREMAVAHGMVEPTYEERMATYEWALEHRKERARARRLFVDAQEKIAALDPEAFPLATKLLTQHAASTEHGLPPRCTGCNPDDYGDARWPCELVATVCAEPYIAIELPDGDDIEDDWEPTHPDDQPPWKPHRVRDLFPQAFVDSSFIDYHQPKEAPGD